MTSYHRDVQRDWIHRTEAALRALSDDVAVSEISEISTRLRRTLLQLDAAPDERHHATLALMLLDVCATVVQAVHFRQPPAQCSCHAAAWEYARALTRANHSDPRVAFSTWSERFLALARREHPSSPAGEAAALIRTDPAKAWTLRDLARRTGSHHVRLSRQFQNIFGVRPSEYVHLVRVSRAVGRFRAPDKVDTIASEIGYRSKKDFYAALKRWVGLTPADLRALPEDERLWLEQQLRTRLFSTVADVRATQRLAKEAAFPPDRYRDRYCQPAGDTQSANDDLRRRRAPVADSRPDPADT
jgi:AraC-like DNA-binding protein